MRPSLFARCVLAAALSLPLRAVAQEAPPAQGEAVRVYLHCSGFYCDMEYLQQEIAFVTHVRDRADADVHVLITVQATGGDGREYTLAFLGQRRFAGATQTLRYLTEANQAEDRVRAGLANTLRLGLVRYAAESPQAAQLRVTYAAPQQAAAAERDPWNRWTFRVDGNGFFNGEQSYSNRYLYGALSAARVTEAWKLRLSLSGSNDRTEFAIDSAQTIVNQQHSYGFNGLLARSLGPHLSAGIRASAASASYLNQDLSTYLTAAVEYDLYPYAQSTRRQLVVQYSVGPRTFDYEVETIFGRTSETLVRQSLLTALVLKQPWGSVDVELDGSSYLHDLGKNRLELGGGVELNLVRGLSLNVSGSFQRIRDQLYLPAGEATPEEILLRRRQLATDFQYYASLGLSYTFGSKFSSVVNPRFNATP
ncbi:MAG TPA: hypothetical protein VEW03_02660 [Longimicrobiaceae bacterium]|nr:hypothetical protein [Longimicrobiaceae bacterium]